MNIAQMAIATIATILTVGLASCSSVSSSGVVSADERSSDVARSETVEAGSQENAGAQEEAVNPCAGSDPGASVNSDAAADPCAGAALISFFAEDGVAIRGADPVAYFTQGEAVIGRREFEHDWNGTTWRFVSEEHRDLFAANPEQYAPAYGGYCAWAVSQGYTAPVDPEAWRIVDGTLYLNYDQRIQQRWAQDIAGNIAKADQNWPEVLN